MLYFIPEHNYADLYWKTWYVTNPKKDPIKERLIAHHEELKMTLMSIISKYQANHEHSIAYGIKSIPYNNACKFNEFSQYSNELNVINDINKLKEEIEIMTENNDKLRKLFMLIYFGRTNTLHALPEDVLMYCMYKYPHIVCQFSVHRERFHINKEVDVPVQKRVKFKF